MSTNISKPDHVKSPGLNCPHCNMFIPVTIQQIIESDNIKCPACNLQLRAQEVMDARRKEEDAKRLDEASKFKR